MDDFDILSKVIDECATNEIIKKIKNQKVNVHSIKIDGGVKVCELCGMEMEREIDNGKEWRLFGAADTRHNGDPSRMSYEKNR